MVGCKSKGKGMDGGGGGGAEKEEGVTTPASMRRGRENLKKNDCKSLINSGTNDGFRYKLGI
jgi:hypothetical protein